jgi:hypothetical protein
MEAAMGMDDDRLNEEAEVAMATSYLVQIGRLEECEAHGTYFGGGVWDLEEDFYKEVMNDRNKGDRGPVPWAAGMKSTEYTDLLLKAYKTHIGDGCNYCAKNMAD